MNGETDACARTGNGKDFKLKPTPESEIRVISTGGGAALRKCEHCSPTGYGSCIYSPHKKPQRNDDEKHYVLRVNRSRVVHQQFI